MLCTGRRRSSPEDIATAGDAHVERGHLVEVLNIRYSRAEAAEVAGKAFAGTEDKDPEWAMDWVLGPQLPRGDARRIDLTSMLMTVAIVQHGHPRRGLALGIRDGAGKLEALVVARRFNSAPGADSWAMMSSIVTMMSGAMLPFYDGRLPAVFADAKLREQIGTGLNRRGFETIFPMMEEMHAEWAAMPHWYVAIMAVLPDAQGEGKCSTLMRAISRVADAENVPCYLECSGHRNRDVYAHLGYEQKKQYTLPADKEEPGSEDFEEFFAMVRPAQGSTGVPK